MMTATPIAPSPLREIAPEMHTPVPVAGERVSTPQLHALTALRFFAAAMIVLLHAQGYFGDIPALQRFTLTQGVCFFYVLSGFVLTYAHPHLDRRHLARFWVGRFARIVPLHLVTLALYVLILPAWFRDSVASITPTSGILTVFLLQAWVPVYRIQTAFNGVAWSLSVEGFFYLCFPLLLWHWRRTWVAKLVLALVLTAGMIVVVNTGLRQLPPGVDARDLVYFHPLARLWEFLLGIATAHLWRYLHPRARWGHGVGTLLEAAVLGITLWVMVWSGAWAREAGQNALVGPGGEAWLASSGWVCIPFAALILVMGLGRGAIAHLLACRPFVRLGEISFSLYLLQLLMFHAYVLHPEPLILTPWWLLYLGGGSILLLSAYVGWTWVEVPGRRAVLRLWERFVTRDTPPSRQTLHPVSPIATKPRQWTRIIAATVLVGTIASIAMLPFPSLPSPATLALVPATQGRARIAVDLIGKHPVTAGESVQIARGDYPSGAVTVEGWSIDQTGPRLARGVLVSVDDQTGTWTKYGSMRNDVSRYLDDTRLGRSGYIGVLPLEGLHDGLHTITIRALVTGSDTYSETTRTFLLR